MANLYVHKEHGGIVEFPEPEDIENYYTVPHKPLSEVVGKKYNPISEAWEPCPAYNELVIDAARRSEYGAIGDQLDEIYHDIDAWRARIAQVKLDNPK